MKQHLLTQDLVRLEMFIIVYCKIYTIIFLGSEEPEEQMFFRNESDIEIISNPSENSVEILEVISRLEKC